MVHHGPMSSTHDVVESLAGIDLNLMVAFDVLARTRSVTRAAVVLGVTQSAMSHTLRRLRAALHDPLLVRVGSALVLTPRAEVLRVPLRAALVSMGRALAIPDTFDPATARRTFRLVAPDLFDLLALPSLVARIAGIGPGIDLAMVPSLGPRLTADLETGDVDLAILPVGPYETVPDGASDLVRRTVFEDGYRCFVRIGHPGLVDGQLSLDAYLAWPHVLVSPTGAGDGIVDGLLAARGLHRRIAARVPSFAVAPRIVARSELVLTAPAMLAETLGDLPVVAVGAPVDLPVHGVAMVWHRRYAADPGHRWLRELIAEVASR